MTDEIFDYFGESPRKVEPVENDDFFEDLMPKHEVAKGSEPEKEAETSIVAEPVEEVSETPEVVVEDRPESVAEADDNDDFGLESHWDSLAVSLGLEAASQPQFGADKVKDETEDVVEAEIASPIEADVEAELDLGGSVDGDASNENVLADMFASGNEDFNEPAEPMAEVVDELTARNFDDDPFAAFHRPIADAEPDGEEESPQAMESDSEPEQSHLVVSDDFVEFEIKELDQSGGGGGRERGRDGGRRGRSKSTDSGRRERGRRNDTEGRDDSKIEDAEPKRRKKRRRDRESSEIGYSDSEHREGRRGKRSSQQNESERESTSSRKKPKIPTWDDAICGVIEKNIKRHRSGGGKSGRKRRH